MNALPVDRAEKRFELALCNCQQDEGRIVGNGEVIPLFGGFRRVRDLAKKSSRIRAMLGL